MSAFYCSCRKRRNVEGPQLGCQLPFAFRRTLIQLLPGMTSYKVLKVTP